MKRVIVILVLILSVFFVNAETLPSSDESKTTSYTITSPIVQVAELKYEPYPVEPGEYFTLWLRVDNIADEDAENVRVELVDSYPFSKETGNVITIGKLGRRQSSVIKFENIKVDDKALSADSELELRIYMGGAYEANYLTKKIIIRVQMISPILSLIVNTEPDKIPQGGTAEVSIDVQNMDKAMVKDVTIDLNLPDSFVTLGSIEEKKIPRLGPGEKSKVEYKVMALSDAESKAYQIPIEITYYDQLGNAYAKNNTIGLLVGAEPSFTLNLESADVFESGTRGKITISLSNTGPSQLKFVTLEILPTDDYTILSNSKSYLGNLDPDDFETSEYTIYVNKKGELPIKLKVTYKDSYNNDKEYVGEVKLKVYSYFEVRKYGLRTGGTSILVYIVYLLLIIFAYLTFKEWRKERDVGRAMKNALKRMIMGAVNIIRKLRWRNLKRLPRRIKLFLQQ
ncbi:MAG: COG1361 S-layer family protein [Candidatus Nanoarchaeia archaeon]